MNHILERFYNEPSRKSCGQEHLFKKAAENFHFLYNSISDAQKEALEAYLDADEQINDLICFEKFRYAFHLGAQLMQELIEGKT